MSSIITGDFCVFILSYKRHDNVITYKTLKKSGYTGKIYIVTDNTDDTVCKYREIYGDHVLTFNKQEWADNTDSGDNTGNLNTVLYARNACFALARQVGCRYFIVLDDDYTGIQVRFNNKGQPIPSPLTTKLDFIFLAMLDFYKKTNTLSLAMAQGGDYLGGQKSNNVSLRRKAMNSFICSTDRPFTFFSRMNDDVSTYVVRTRRGELFFTVMQVMLSQKQTQTSLGGLTDMYLNAGTYVKSFYTVMYAPSCCKVGIMGDHRSGNYRFHHALNWHRIAPKILREYHKKV